jgi:hypothetical protein
MADQPGRTGEVPPGSPSWITKESIDDTLRVWEPRYKKHLTETDAVEILINVAQLLDALDLTETSNGGSAEPDRQRART